MTISYDAPPLYLKRQIIRLNAAEIGYIQYPEFFMQYSLKPRVKKATAVLGGEWDSVLNKSIYWGSKYEEPAAGEVGMIALRDYVFFSSAKEHYHQGKPWSETNWYDWMVQNAPSRYTSHEGVTERLHFLDTLYEAAVSGRMKFEIANLPRVNIGRDGRISIDDGRHRLCIAILADVRDVSVAVSYVHPDASDSEHGKEVLSEPASILQRLRRYLGKSNR